MPRQLPWLNKGGGSRTQVKPVPQPAKRSRNLDEIEDDFFEGTALASSRKGKERAESDGDLSLPLSGSLRASHKGEGAAECARMPSSSPPPMSAPLSPPRIEYMRRGVDKFDLRDDEWMMVEDELLQTANTFTRHLHLAEYERMKAEMEERNNQVSARPVIPNAQPSDEGRLKMKAQEQTKRQKKAIQDFFAAASDDEQDAQSIKPHPEASKKHKAPSRMQRDPTVQRLRAGNKSASDSDDLNAAPRPYKASTRESTKAKNPADRAELGMSESDFVKPTLPSNDKAKAKPKRPTPFDMWDDFVPSRPSSPPRSTNLAKSNSLSTTKRETPTLNPPSSSFLKPPPSSKPSNTLPFPRTKTPTRSVDLFEDTDFPDRGTQSKETPDRLAKHKEEKETEKEKETPSKSRKSIDDIPTFLF